MARSKQPPDATADARAALAQLESDLASWQTQLDTDRDELARLHDTAGVSLVDGELTADDLAAQTRTLEVRIDGATRAIAEVGRRVERARSAVVHTIADDLDRQADQLQPELDAHTSKVAGLLTELAALDEWTYRAVTLEERIHELHGGHLLDATGQSARVSVTDRLAQPINELRRDAAAIRERAGASLTADEYQAALSFVNGRLGTVPADAAAA